MVYERGTVVKGPDLLADHDYRPYVSLNDDTHPFSDEEGRLVDATTDAIAREAAGYLGFGKASSVTTPPDPRPPREDAKRQQCDRRWGRYILMA